MIQAMDIVEKMYSIVTIETEILKLLKSTRWRLTYAHVGELIFSRNLEIPRGLLYVVFLCQTELNWSELRRSSDVFLTCFKVATMVCIHQINI